MSDNGTRRRNPLDSVDDAIAKLEGTDWVDDDEITGQDLLEAVRVGAAAATGKHRAMSKEEADEVTPTDPPRKVESDAPPSKLSPQAIAWLLVRKFPPWGAVLVALAGIAAYVLLRR